MKLLNYTSAYFALPLLLILSVWAGIFYFAMLDEVYDSLGDVLQHQKTVVLQKAARDSTVLQRADFDDGYYTIRETTAAKARNFQDQYLDTLLYLQVEEDHEPIRMLITMFQQNGRFYELRVITSMVEEDDLIDELLYSLVYLYLGLLATILLLNNFLLRRIWRPFYNLLQRLQHFRLDAPAPIELPETRVDEFKLLNTTIDKVLQSNQAVYQQQKQFIENASHELQTPLAICRNKLELLADSNNLTPEQGLLVESALNNLNRMARLNKSLALLTRIENRQFQNIQRIPVKDCLQEILSDLESQLQHQQLTVKLHEDHACHLQMDPDLAKILFGNLIKNAMVHNKAGGYLHITIGKKAVSFHNSGQEVPLDTSKIFGRFQTSGKTGTSTGLGLAIVKAISDLYNLQISYRFQNEHIFEISC